MRVRVRVLGTVVFLTVTTYLLWSWSVAGSHDVVAIVSGVALVPLFILLVALMVRQAAFTVGRAAWRSRHRSRATVRLPSTRRRARPGATTMVPGGHEETSPPGGSPTPSPAKIAA